MYVKLMTKEIERELEAHPMRSQESAGYEARVLVKYFNPCGGATWLVTEAERDGSDWIFYGFVTMGFRDQLNPGHLLYEWGCFRFSEIDGLRNVLGLKMERDRFCDCGRYTVRQLADGAKFYDSEPEAVTVDASAAAQAETVTVEWTPAGAGQQVLF